MPNCDFNSPSNVARAVVVEFIYLLCGGRGGGEGGSELHKICEKRTAGNYIGAFIKEGVRNPLPTIYIKGRGEIIMFIRRRRDDTMVFIQYPPEVFFKSCS